ncbi:MAG: SPFH domain-containing protein [Proteocatella sp.]
MSTFILPASIAVVVLLFIAFTWRKVPSDKAAIVTGLGKAKVLTGAGTIVIPILQRIDYITLENIGFEVTMKGTLTSNAVPVNTTGTVVVKIKNNTEMIKKAVEQFNCGKAEETKAHIAETARDVCEGRLREVIADMTAEELFKDRKTFSEKVKEVAENQLDQLGLELKSFTIKEIGDPNGYFEALSKPQIAAVKRDAEIAEAEARKESMVSTSEADRAGERARLEADAKKAEALKEAEVKKLEFKREQDTSRAKTDAAYAIQESITRKDVTNAAMDAEILKEQRAREVREAQIQVEIAAEQKNIELAQKKALRKEQELLETSIKPAEAEKRVRELEAEADKVTVVREAEANAEAKKLDASAEAEMIRLRGQAEADAIKLKGLAEAEAMEKKAEAYAKYGQAAITEMIVAQLPEIARAVAEPMAKIGNISIIGGGADNGSATDVTRMALGSLKAVTESMKDILGFDITDVMRSNTIQAKTDRNISVDPENAKAVMDVLRLGNDQIKASEGAAEPTAVEANPEINE